MATTKKEFAWDKETFVKEIVVNEYEKRMVMVAELKGKQYVCVATHKKIKDDWKPVKNATFPMDVWKQVVEAMGDFELQAAFGSTTEIKAPKKETAAQKKKREQAELKKQRESLEAYAAKINDTEPIKGTAKRKNSKKPVKGIEKK
jgi:hypothetical protein